MVLSENLLDIFMAALLTKKGMTQTELIYSHKNRKCFAKYFFYTLDY